MTVDGASPDGFVAGAQIRETSEVRLVKVSDEVLAESATATLDGDSSPVVAATGDGPGLVVFGVEVPYGRSGVVEFAASTMVDGVETPVRFSLDLRG